MVRRNLVHGMALDRDDQNYSSGNNDYFVEYDLPWTHHGIPGSYPESFDICIFHDNRIPQQAGSNRGDSGCRRLCRTVLKICSLENGRKR